MATYSEKLKDPRWQKLRLQVLQRDDFTCQYCGEKTKTLHVHHLCYPKSRNPWDVDDDALLTVCCDCHSIDHYEGFTILEKFLIDYIIDTSQVKNDKRIFSSIKSFIINRIK